ncbi:hypothetical protein PILCRDRAFT_219741 [Piloderma croceum F 1598]|uniref:Uncharacterized protein n=1 Tax=Piloderma croceum (strain F 1598) TaxID=765440 RepID=A0A0C3FYM9_PILCF|nr:hypothetical protein PILCRDRAFT_219741 [Piloderma croceum F 1598]
MQGSPFILKNRHFEDIFPTPVCPIGFPFPAFYDKPTATILLASQPRSGPQVRQNSQLFVRDDSSLVAFKNTQRDSVQRQPPKSIVYHELQCFGPVAHVPILRRDRDPHPPISILRISSFQPNVAHAHECTVFFHRNDDVEKSAIHKS